MISSKRIPSREILRICLAIVAPTLTVRAELPPSVYQELQEKSPEALTIRIESVSVSTSNNPAHTALTITAQARVETVIRSASGLKPGDMIRLSYVHLEHKQPLPGPSEPPVLQKGQSYPAFLVKGGPDRVYAPAAQGYSFQKMDQRD